MILADTSVWVSHIREGEPRLQQALVDAKVFMHPFVLGEIACGNLRGRSQTLHRLGRLPSPVSASNDEVLALLERHHLFGKGLGWVDAHLLASARLTGCRLWTLDRSLRDAANALKVRFASSAVM
jgi:predicted nucleic acid-binding protein